MPKTPVSPHSSPRAWMRLPSGPHLDLMNPSPDAWTDEDPTLHKSADLAAAATEAAHVVGWSDVEIRDVLRIDFAVLDVDPLVAVYGGTPWEPWPVDVAAERFLLAMTLHKGNVQRQGA